MALVFLALKSKGIFFLFSYVFLQAVLTFSLITVRYFAIYFLTNYLLKLNTPILPNLDAVPPATLAVLNYDNSSLSLSNPLFNSSSV